jgi:hypothetical protein
LSAKGGTETAAFEPAPVNDQRCISVQNIAFGALAVAAGFGLHQLVASIQNAISCPSACRAPATVRNLPGDGKIQRLPVYAGLTTGDNPLDIHPCPVIATAQLT